MTENGEAPGSQASLREANSARLLNALTRYGQLTQVELAAATGLSPATVSNIVRQLVADGAVETSVTTRSGRRAQLVTLARNDSMAAGIHAGPRSLDVTLVDANLREVARQHLPLPAAHRFDTTLDRAALLVSELTSERGIGLHDLVGVGVAMPAGGRVGADPGLPSWAGVDVADTLGRRLGRPVFVTREIDAAASAEARLGALRGTECGIYVRVGDTTDSAIVIRGSVLRVGTHAAAGIGHVRVSPGGAICRCGGRGCLNTEVSIDSLRESLRISHGPMSLRDIVSAAKGGDPGCQQVISDAGAAIGSALADLATALGPDRISVGGPLARAGDILLSPIRDALEARPLLRGAEGLLGAGHLNESAETLGAAAYVFDMMSLVPMPDTARGGGRL
jgi:predicted NBD/HSP70 family sugar kinase